MRLKWRFRSLRISFGLTPEYMENVYEQFFFLQYSGGWSLTEAYSLPIGLREWFVKRLIKQLEDEKQAIEETSRNSGNKQTLGPHNSPKRM